MSDNQYGETEVFEIPNEDSLIAIRETEERIENGSGESYQSGRDLIQAALA